MNENEDDNYVTARQYDRDETLNEDEGAPDSLDGEGDEADVLKILGGKRTALSVQRVSGWQVSEVCSSELKESEGIFLLLLILFLHIFT